MDDIERVRAALRADPETAHFADKICDLDKYDPLLGLAANFDGHRGVLIIPDRCDSTIYLDVYVMVGFENTTEAIAAQRLLPNRVEEA